jgi:hypothetical protein
MKIIPLRFEDSVVEQIDIIAAKQQRKRSALMKIWVNSGIQKEVQNNESGSNTIGNTVL